LGFLNANGGGAAKLSMIAVAPGTNPVLSATVIVTGVALAVRFWSQVVPAGWMPS
jgi:hypothetical protein